MRVESLWIYPIKSTRGQQLAEAGVERYGLENDRRWAVIDAEGRLVTSRENDKLLKITAVHDEGGLVLTAPHSEPLRVAPLANASLSLVELPWLAMAADAGAPASTWCSAVLGESVRLIWGVDPLTRPVPVRHGGQDGDHLNLADAGPLLLTTRSSLAQLNDWIAEHDAEAVVSMQRFRPSVVIEGDISPFDEDTWRRLRIGAVEYRFAEVCDRCVLTTIDPDSLAHDKEPIRTLARHRKWDGKTWFGVRLIPVETGQIRVGDAVEVIERSSPTHRLASSTT